MGSLEEVAKELNEVLQKHRAFLCWDNYEEEIMLDFDDDPESEIVFKQNLDGEEF